MLLDDTVFRKRLHWIAQILPWHDINSPYSITVYSITMRVLNTLINTFTLRQNFEPTLVQEMTRRPAIIWTIDDLVYLCIYATFGFDELSIDWYGTRCIYCAPIHISPSLPRQSYISNEIWSHVNCAYLTTLRVAPEENQKAVNERLK